MCIHGCIPCVSEEHDSKHLSFNTSIVRSNEITGTLKNTYDDLVRDIEEHGLACGFGPTLANLDNNKWFTPVYFSLEQNLSSVFPWL
jgi:hypothetical protein